MLRLHEAIMIDWNRLAPMDSLAPTEGDDDD